MNTSYASSRVLKLKTDFPSCRLSSMAYPAHLDLETSRQRAWDRGHFSFFKMVRAAIQGDYRPKHLMADNLASQKKH